jgi:hypothetical protein
MFPFRRVGLYEEVPRFYGTVYYDFRRDSEVTCLVPFHFPLRLARVAWEWFLFSRPSRLERAFAKLKCETRIKEREETIRWMYAIAKSEGTAALLETLERECGEFPESR